jgi:hypothetical protein
MSLMIAQEELDLNAVVMCRNIARSLDVSVESRDGDVPRSGRRVKRPGVAALGELAMPVGARWQRFVASLLSVDG